MISPEERATHVCFKDTAFLMARGLSPDNVLEYLSLSQFYDPSCLNEQLRMQARFSNALVSNVSSSGGETADTRARRLGMRGLEYELWFSVPSPSLFVIRRQMRQSPTRGLHIASSSVFLDL